MIKQGRSHWGRARVYDSWVRIDIPPRVSLEFLKQLRNVAHGLMSHPTHLTIIIYHDCHVSALVSADCQSTQPGEGDVPAISPCFWAAWPWIRGVANSALRAGLVCEMDFPPWLGILEDWESWHFWDEHQFLATLRDGMYHLETGNPRVASADEKCIPYMYDPAAW